MDQMSGYLAAKFIGSGVAEDVSGEFESIAEHCKRTKNHKLLIDTTGFDLKISTLDRYLVGERVQMFARYGIKVAFICRPEQVDSRKFGIQVAKNRGMDVEVFTDLQAAEEWLLK